MTISFVAALMLSIGMKRFLIESLCILRLGNLFSTTQMMPTSAMALTEAATAMMTRVVVEEAIAEVCAEVLVSGAEGGGGTGGGSPGEGGTSGGGGGVSGGGDGGTDGDGGSTGGGGVGGGSEGGGGGGGQRYMCTRPVPYAVGEEMARRSPSRASAAPNLSVVLS